MFKLESYLTPLLLGYVDKYVKNLKAEDFQLSLWGGDALFTNLDLRLDVLEEEFHLPFTFTNGHIHELRLHVPWTKLGSEPIVITIETIECVLTLKDPNCSDSSSSEHAKPKSDSTKKKQRKNELTQEAPPGYVQGFISRIVNNISVVCNNLILKYVEDDIVLSLNIKSAEMYNVDEGWEKAFTDLSLQSPVLRKVINIHDLTICLDKRNASGIIEVYQDPLLFRCSAWCRIYKSYDNPHSKLASMSHVSIYCDQLDFSVTDQQLPMLTHLMELCLALYNGDLVADQKPTSGNRKAHGNTDEKDEVEVAEIEAEQQGWGSWAWSYVPQIMPLWDEQGEQNMFLSPSQQLPPSNTFRFRLLIERMSLVIKLTQRLRTSKVSFHSVAVLRQYGTSIGVIQHNGSFINCQIGVTAAEVIQLDSCVCGGSFQIPSERVFLQSGVMPGEGHTYSFLTSSLFDPLSPENGCNEAPQLELDWDSHIDCLTEQVMLDRFPAVALDYLYELEVPPEWSDKTSELTSTFIEGSNWHERSLSRIVMGMAYINITSGLVHLIDRIYTCARKHDYTPYSTPQPTQLSLLPVPSEEDFHALESFVPTRSYHIVWHQPSIRVHLPDHPKGLGAKEKSRRRDSTQYQQDQKPVGSNMPLLIRASTVDIHLNKSFYPKKVAQYVFTAPEPSEVLLHHCFIHTHFKAFQLELSLLSSPQEQLLVPPFSLAYMHKVVQDVDLLWGEDSRAQGRAPSTKSEQMLEVAQGQLQMNKGQMNFLLCFGLAWLWDAPLPPKLNVQDLLSHADEADNGTLLVDMGSVILHSVETWHSLAHQMTLLSLSVQLMNQYGQQTVLFNGPERTNSIHNAASFRDGLPCETTSLDPLVMATVQVPIRPDKIVEQAVVVIQFSGFVINLDPLLFSWLHCRLNEDWLVQQVPDILPQTLNSNTSSPSNERSSTYSLSQTTSNATLDMKPPADASGSCYSWKSWILDVYHKLFKHAAILVDMKAGCLLCPVSSWSTSDFASSPPPPTSSLFEGRRYSQSIPLSVVSQWHQSNSGGQSSPLCVLALPHLVLNNQASHSRLQNLQLAIPILEAQIGGAMFPWTVSFQDCSMYTIDLDNTQLECVYLVKPVGASLTLAISEPLAQLALCVHVDVEPLYFSVSKAQVNILTQVTNKFLVGLQQVLKAKSFFDALTSALQTSRNPTGTNTVSQWHREPLPSGLVISQIPFPPQILSPRSSEGLCRDLSSPSSSSVEHMSFPTEVKLTLWMQWTLPKVGLSFLTSQASTKEQVWLQLDAEEVTASLDVQPVFLKGKAKVTSFNISNFHKTANSGDWQPGSYDGIILCGLDKISRNMVLSSSSNSSGEYKASKSSSNNKSFPSFLSFTFTQVLCSSVEQYWAKKLKDVQLDPAQHRQPQGLAAIGESGVALEQTKYISEFDMKLDHFDVVLWVPLLSSVVDIASPVKLLARNPFLLDLMSSKDLSGKNIKKPLGWSLNVSNLPLLYLHVGTVRLFLPCCSNSKKTDKPFDMLMAQTSSVMLLPQAENLLSRMVFNEQMYQAAGKTGSLYVPGAPIEDRQYQLDIKGLMLTTVLWQDIHDRSNLGYHVPMSVPPTLGQNPAVEWNNRTVPLEEEDDTILIHPIVSPFDLKTVVAPAIVCQMPKSSSLDSPKETLVCGHSLELNAVSDVDLYLSFQSATLVQEVVQNNLLRGSTQLSENIQGLSPTDGQAKSSVIKDSGIESEVTSGQQVDMTLLSLLTNPLLTSVSDTHSKMPFVPAEVLLTANKVFVTLFLNETDLQMKLNPGSSGKRKTHRRSKKKPSPAGVAALNAHDVYSHKGKKASKHQKKQDPVSVESSPERIFSIPARKPKISLTKGSSEDGYDGSNDSSSTCSFQMSSPVDNTGHVPSPIGELSSPSASKTSPEEGQEINRGIGGGRAHPRIHPFLRLVFSQPHTFIMCKADTQKVQVSCFDFNIKSGRHNMFVEALGPAYCPLPGHFTVPWLETIPGDSDTKTGTPPPWLTFTCNDFLSRPGQVSITSERPTLIHLSVTRFHQARAVLLSILPQFFPPAIDEEQAQDELPVTMRLNKVLQQVKKVELSFVHLAATVESSHAASLEHNLGFSVGAVQSSLQLKPEKTGEKIITELTLKDFLLNVNIGKVCRHVLGPFSSSIDYEIWWPSWLPNSAAPSSSVSMLKVNSGPLFLTFAPKQLQVLKQTLDAWKDIIMPDPLNASRADNKNCAIVCPSASQKDQQVLHTYDDIRNGSFEFLHDWDGQGVDASPGEVVFCKDPAEKQGSMTWCYPEPRILTRVEVYPVPLQPSSGLSSPVSSSSSSANSKSQKPCNITCSLQFWDSFKGVFVDWHSFELQESSSSTLDLPPDSLHTSHLHACTHKWRVILKCTDPADDYLPVLPNVLAACMRVDSCFQSAYVPTLQASFNVDFIQVSVCNCFRNMVVIPDALYPFTPDGQFPQDQEFLVASVDNSSFAFKHWNDKLKLSGNFSVSAEILEYRNLTLQTLLEPVDFHLSLLLSQTVENRKVLESEINMDPCYLHFSQSTFYTLNTAHQSWKQFMNPKEHGEQMVPNFFVICNNTQENIRFGQVSTDESVLLGSQKMHAYSWRSHKTQQLLRLCLESMYWKWCDPFSLDTLGTKVRVMESKGYSVTLIIHVRKINNVQKQVIVTGQVTISSRLSYPLEVRLLSQPTVQASSSPETSTKASQSSHWLELRCLPQSHCSLGPYSTLAAYFLTSSQPVGVQLRVQQVDTTWCQTIYVTGKEAQSLQLIKIPGQETFDVWCKIFTEEVLPHVPVHLVVLCPTFVLRNHLPVAIVAHLQRPSEGTLKCLEVAGQGQDTELLTTSQQKDDPDDKCGQMKDVPKDDGDLGLDHFQLLFQLGSTKQPSSPAVQLPSLTVKDYPSAARLGEMSAELALELEECREVLDGLCHNWLPLEPFCWPYLDSDRHRNLSKLSKRNSLLQYEAHSYPVASEIPNTQLNVRVYQPWACIPTYLVDIKPWALFVNHSTWDLYLQIPGASSTEVQQWHIHKGTVFTPPPIQAAFMLAVEQDGNFYTSSKMKFGSGEDVSLNPGVVQLEPQCPVHLSIHLVVADTPKVFRVAVQLQVQDDMYVLVFKPHVTLINETNIPLHLLGSLGSTVNHLPGTSSGSLQLAAPSSQIQGQGCPILLWNLSDSTDLSSAAYILSLCPSDPNCQGDIVSLSEEESWCKPSINLDLQKTFSRFTVSTSTKPQQKQRPLQLVVTCHQHEGSLFVTVHQDLHPLLCIHNRTDFPLIYGENTQATGLPSVTQSCGLLPNLPCNTSSYFTFPSVNNVFPASLPQMPTLCLAKDPSCPSDSKTSPPSPSTNKNEMWSPLIDVSSEVDLFVHIPHAGDIRVHKERAGHTMHAFLESVNRVEVSAKEIRSRIAAKTQAIEIKAKDMAPVSSSKFVIFEKEASYVKQSDPVLYVSVLFSHVCVILLNDISDPCLSEEVVRFCLDDVFAIMRPLELAKEHLVSLRKQDVTFCIGNLQVDNQLTGAEVFDFKVVVVPQVSPSSGQHRTAGHTLNSFAKHSELAVLTANLSVDFLQQDNLFVVQRANVKVEPLAVYLEDNLYHHLVQLRRTFVENGKISCREFAYPDPLVPKKVLEESGALSRPLPVVQLEINPVSMLVSLRASLKLYLSVDQSPLSFQIFQQNCLYTSSYGLGQLLTVHYVTGALLRAGWVVGSLDLLGNPTGLARALSTGLSDLVLLPYCGMFQGPWAFVSGITHGTASLLKQISSGAIVSVTNLAASISRNMDRLSLDQEHSQRLEEMRHSPPEGLASGLKQGLTGFGISLLGAVAGIVDQPLQAIISSPTAGKEEPNTSASTPTSTHKGLFRTASGIVGGASRGLVGMVVKPIGGAAELISQAGTGLLQGVGWRNHPQTRYDASHGKASFKNNSLLKFSWKMVPGLIPGLTGGSAGPGQVLMSLEATHVSHPGGFYVADVLFLSSHILAIVSKDEDRQQQMFALTEIDCCGCPDNPSILYITIKPKTSSVPVEVDHETTKRVAEYIHQVSSELGHTLSWSGVQEEGNVSWRDGYQFYVLPKLRNHFIALFNIEQRKLLGRRFLL